MIEKLCKHILKDGTQNSSPLIMDQSRENIEWIEDLEVLLRS